MINVRRKSLLDLKDKSPDRRRQFGVHKHFSFLFLKEMRNRMNKPPELPRKDVCNVSSIVASRLTVLAVLLGLWDIGKTYFAIFAEN